MVSACVAPTVKHGGGGVVLRECFVGDSVADLFVKKGNNGMALISHTIFVCCF